MLCFLYLTVTMNKIKVTHLQILAEQYFIKLFDMKKFLYLASFLFLVNCAHKEPAEFDLESISGEWISLTEIEGEKVIYNPCSEVNRSFEIVQENGVWKVIESVGQEAFSYTINSTTLEGADLVLKTIEYNYNEPVELRLKDFDTQKNVLIWNLDKSPYEKEIELVKSAAKKDYLVVDEIC